MRNQLTMAAFAAALFISGCDSTQEPIAEDQEGSVTVSVVNGRLSIPDQETFQALLAQATDQTDVARRAWESGIGFQSLATTLAEEGVTDYSQVRTEAGTPIVEAAELAALLNSEGELLLEDYLLKVDGVTATLLSPSGEVVKEQEVIVGEVTSTQMARALPRNVQQQFGDESILAIEREDDRHQKEFQITGTIKKVDYIVYARWAAGTEAEELFYKWTRGLYYGETPAVRVELHCELADGTVYDLGQSNDSDVEKNFQAAFMDPRAIEYFGTAGMQIETTEVLCSHYVKDYSSHYGKYESVTVHTAW